MFTIQYPYWFFLCDWLFRKYETFSCINNSNKNHKKISKIQFLLLNFSPIFFEDEYSDFKANPSKLLFEDIIEKTILTKLYELKLEEFTLRDYV